MDARRRYRRSDLFLVRIWLEEGDVSGSGSGREERRGRVQRVVDGEAYQFNDWTSLIELLITMTTTDKKATRIAPDVNDNSQPQRLEDE